MAYSIKRFVEEVERIAATNPTYRTGGIGRDGTCDCIGMIIGAMYAMGRKKYDMKSTNYFARYQMLSLQPIDKYTPLEIGALVYKSRKDDGRLHERYKPGGRYYTGDTNDYYHVGVVTSEVPLRITHCTEWDGKSGIVVDTKTGNWGFVGRLRGLVYDEVDDEPFGILPSETGDELENGMVDEPAADDETKNTTGTDSGQYAVVTSPNGEPVKLRKSASTREPIWWRVNPGEKAMVERKRGSWSLIRVRCDDGHVRQAYMMTKFLEME